jgi:hypothetical protein
MDDPVPLLDQFARVSELTSFVRVGSSSLAEACFTRRADAKSSRIDVASAVCVIEAGGPSAEPSAQSIDSAAARFSASYVKTQTA